MGQKKKVSRRSGSFPVEFRLKIVKLFTEEGYSIPELAEEFACGKSTIGTWVKLYREHGEQALYAPTKQLKTNCKALNNNLKSKIIELKKDDPQRGVRRISDILKRFFLLKASPETVRQALHEENLIDPPPKKRLKNIQKPRRFERTTPNQMWQTDICCFRLAGKNAYLLGFIDDYSRYIVGMGLYRSQTAANLLEIYRTAVGEYGVPREMLTDNGRQYTNWRGTTNFEKELKKDRVKHIKSSPHHPMTLGKIERFWKTILNEFLFRCQFDSFENARERLALWIKYYNCKRPHQGIGGLCPADRFFEVQNELKTTLEKGVEENILELALRGKPQQPFYMVGRLGGQNVAIRAEKGKIKMHVDDPERIEGKELVYDLNAEHINDNEREKSAIIEAKTAITGNNSSGAIGIQCEVGSAITGQKTEPKTNYSCVREMQSCAFSVDGEPFSELDLPGIIGHASAGFALAGNRDGGDIASLGPDAAQDKKDGFEQPFGEIIDESQLPEREDAAAGGALSDRGGKREAFTGAGDVENVNFEEDLEFAKRDRQEESERFEDSQNERIRRPQARRTYFKGKKRPDDRNRRRFRAGRFT
jgi:transposase InsO family protein